MHVNLSPQTSCFVATSMVPRVNGIQDGRCSGGPQRVFLLPERRANSFWWASVPSWEQRYLKFTIWQPLAVLSAAASCFLPSPVGCRQSRWHRDEAHALRVLSRLRLTACLWTGAKICWRILLPGAQYLSTSPRPQPACTCRGSRGNSMSQASSCDTNALTCGRLKRGESLVCCSYR